MFRITGGKGFHLTFANGYTISVQFGYGNYCDNYYADFDFYKTPASKIDLKSENAEIAIWDANGHWCTKDFFDDLQDNVKGRVSANEVGELINKVMNA